MTATSAVLRRAVAGRAQQCCDLADDVALVPHEPDHIIGMQHGGGTRLTNLAYACFRCNRFKGPNIATRDPQTGRMVSLFNPRAERWEVHFRLDGAQIVPLTPIGRGTALLLRFNDEERLLLRAELIRQGRYRPPSRLRHERLRLWVKRTTWGVQLGAARACDSGNLTVDLTVNSA